MQVLVCNLAALAIAVLYYSWREGHLKELRKERLLRVRVAQMLFAAAERALRPTGRPTPPRPPCPRSKKAAAGCAPAAAVRFRSSDQPRPDDPPLPCSVSVTLPRRTFCLAPSDTLKR